MKNEAHTPNIVVMLNRRQLGLPIKENGRSVRHSINNYRCDFQLLKCLLSVRDTYLEVIAGKQVQRSNAPSFCRNRLFTNNYRTWFNLCTSPTSGPTLVKLDIFHPEKRQGSALTSRPRILNGITVDPPNGCQPLPDSQHLPCILLLSKDGWLYQYTLEDATCLKKVFIPTKFFSDFSSTGTSGINDRENETTRTKDRISSLVFSYQYIDIFDEEGSRILISSAYNSAGRSFKAYLIMGLFPLRIINHFVTVSKNRSLNIQLWRSIMILTIKTGSLLSLYGLQDILGKFSIDSENVNLGQPIRFWDHNGVIGGCVGDSAIGVPYTSDPIILDQYQEWLEHQLFKTKAIKHLFHIGGIPFHFAVPMNANCSTWSLRKLSDSTEVSRFRVDTFSHEGFISGFDFHDDESGRLRIVNKETVTMYQISEGCNNAQETATGGSTASQIDTSPVKSVAQAGQAGCLRLVSSPLLCHRESVKRRSVVRKCFEIRLEEQGEVTNRDCQDGQLHPISRSSYGRQLRNPERLSMAPIAKQEFKVLSLSYEDELDIIAVLHLNSYSSKRSSPISDSFCDVMVSLYENQTGRKINSIIVEHSLPVSDITSVTFAMDADTVIYARTELSNLVNYKVLRFCRRY